MRIAAVIPARYESSRFPGKPLARISGLSMIERVYRQVAAAACFPEIIVATDDERIGAEVRRFGGIVEMTDNTIKSGTERVWAAIAGRDLDAAVNIQGDEPLIPAKLIRDVAAALEAEPLVSAARRSDSREDFLSPHVVKVVCDDRGRALYFSRAPIPHAAGGPFPGFWQHIGIYGYSKQMLRLFVGSAPGELERRESLEQLRFLQLGLTPLMVMTDYAAHGVDVPGDIARIEALLGN